MSFISYAQNFEDVILMRIFGDIDVGFYIDIGANDPEVDSVTKAFYDKGWRGINIEPVQSWFEKLEKARPNDINLNCAVGNQEDELVLYEIPDTGISTLEKEIANRHSNNGYQIIEHKVQVQTVANICNNYHTSPIHFLKIDVEGHEKSVLEGIDFSVIRPWVVVVESTLPNTQTEVYEDWEQLILDADYQFVYFDGLNRFYLATERQALRPAFSSPPNVFDGFVLSGEANHSFCQKLRRLISNKEAEIQELSIKIPTLEKQGSELAQKNEELSQALDKSESELQQLNTKVSTLEKQGSELVQKNEELSLALDKSGSELQELNTKVSTLEKQGSELAQKNEELSLALDKSESTLHQANKYFNEILGRNKTLVSEVAVTKQSLDSLKTKQYDLTHKLNESLSNAHNWFERAKHAESQLEIAQSELHEAHKSAHYWWQQAAHQDGYIQSLLRSTSWRVTAPLRGFKKGVIWLLKLPLKLLKTLIKPFVYLGLKWVINKPGLRDKLSAKVKKYPRFHQHLRQFAKNRSLIPSLTRQMAKPAESIKVARQNIETKATVYRSHDIEPDLSELTPRARQIYSQLKSAIEQQKGSY